MIHEVIPIGEFRALQQRRDGGVGFQAAPVPARAEPSVKPDGGVAQFPCEVFGISLSVGNNGCADTDINQHQHKILALTRF